MRDVVVDFLGGLKDVEKRTLSLIGKAETRYREDLSCGVEDPAPRIQTDICHIRPMLNKRFIQIF